MSEPSKFVGPVEDCPDIPDIRNNSHCEIRWKLSGQVPDGYVTGYSIKNYVN